MHLDSRRKTLLNYLDDEWIKVVIARAHNADKNSQRDRDISPFFSSYGHLAEFFEDKGYSTFGILGRMKRFLSTCYLEREAFI